MSDHQPNPHPQPPAEGGFARALAARSAALQWGDLPAQALHWARVGILDTLGVTLAGSREPATRLCALSLGLGDGPSLLLGSGRRTSLMSRATFLRAEIAVEALRTPAGLPLTYDVTYLTAHK